MFKIKDFLPNEARIHAKIGNNILEEIKYLEDYYCFDLSNYANEKEIELYAEINGEEILINNCIININNVSYPSFSKENINNSDCYITYNEDGSFNTYLPICFSSNDDLWYQVILNDNIYYEGTDYIPIITNLNKNNSNAISIHYYYRYNGISYLIDSLVLDDLNIIVENNYLVEYDSSDSSAKFTINNFNYDVFPAARVYYSDESYEDINLEIENNLDKNTLIGSYDTNKEISYVNIKYSYKEIDEELLINNKIEIIGNKYQDMNIYPDELFDLVIYDLIYNDYESSNKLLISSNLDIDSNYSLVLEQNGEIINSEEYTNGFYVFDSLNITLDNSFTIRLMENSNFIQLSKKFEYTIISDTSTISIPTYSNNYANPGDCHITYNEDGTINTYLPINFTSDSRDIWYRIKLTDVETDEIHYLEGSDYYAVGSNLANSRYSITYQIYYRYNGISYYISGEYPSGVIEDLNSSDYEVSYDPSVNNEFTIDFAYPVLNTAVINYSDGTSEEVTISSDGITITGSYDSNKLINYITISYSTNLIDEDILNSHNISLVGNQYTTMNIYTNELFEFEINEIVYDDYDGSNKLLINSSVNDLEGYSIYLAQEKADEVIEVTPTRTVGQYLVFDSSTLSLDSAFNLKVKKNSNDVILSKTFEYTIISDTSTLSIPTYSNITPNPGDCYITYNEDDTFNVYIPMNFTSNSSDVFYSIKLHDVEANTDYYIEGNDYIASKCNLNNSKYSIIYQIYYRYNGVSYYITGEWPSGPITGTLDTSSTTLSIDSEKSQFTINNFYYNYLEEVTVKYTDGSSEVVTVDSTYSTGNYDNTKEIASIVVNACEKVLTTEFENTLSSNNIVLVGNKYKEIEITNS